MAPEERDLLVAAAWLHDIGYSEQLTFTGFHPLDGARHLRETGNWDLAVLVAHHSGARFIADYVGLGDELAVYPFAVTALTDALTAADQTVGPLGSRVPVEQRMADMLQRHGPHSPHAAIHRVRSRYLRAAVARTQRRLA